MSPHYAESARLCSITFGANFLRKVFKLLAVVAAHCALNNAHNALNILSQSFQHPKNINMVVLNINGFIEFFEHWVFERRVYKLQKHEKCCKFIVTWVYYSFGNIGTKITIYEKSVFRPLRACLRNFESFRFFWAVWFLILILRDLWEIWNGFGCAHAYAERIWPPIFLKLVNILYNDILDLS